MNRVTWLLLACLALGIQPLKAKNEPVLSGSTQKTENIVLKCDAVFIGQITHMRLGPPASSNVASYTGVKVKVLQMLRGSFDEQIPVMLNVLALNHEEAPTTEGTYIFFLKKESGWNIVKKLLPATNDNIAKVKALIAAAPASK
jgi:hypothetical protein